MPGCAAVGCNNRSEKGYIMKCFPRNPKLRKIWQERVARADWEPSNNSFLCHVHFEPQEWSITQSGRIKLKKNAVPSIFTITSTRKSPKKRTRILDCKSKSILQGEWNVEYTDNDTEHSSIELIEEKDLNFQEFLRPPVESVKHKSERNHKSAEIVLKGNNVKIDRQRQTIMIAEDNLTDITSNFATLYNLHVQSMDERKDVGLSRLINDPETLQTSGIIEKGEIARVMDRNTYEDSYDEIEEKLKQICDGGSTEDENLKNSNKRKSMLKKGGKDGGEGEKLDTKRKEENVEIIFGVESGDEKASVPKNISKMNKEDNNALEYGEIGGIKEEKKVFNEDIEENFTKDEVHVIPNIRAAMKRKRRTREEIMKSIKKSIRSNSDQDVNSSTNSELSDRETEIRNQLSLFTKEINDINKIDTEVETCKFVIKVTGDPDDVTEIIEELSSNTIGTQASKKFSTISDNEESDTFITSIITVVSPKNPKEIVYRNFDSPLVGRKKGSIIDHSPCEEKEFTSLNLAYNCKTCHPSCFKHVCSDVADKHQIKINSPLQNCAHGVQTPFENNTTGIIPSDYEDLLERIQIQEDVISKLTDQLIIYKELENSTRNKNNEREIQVREADTPKVNTRSANTQSLLLCKKNLESKQRLIEDLSNRVNYFEEANKKLMKTVTLESQQKRKLEGHIKQKENRIKELNWKLEKASKYLERAEKNTNTYRRKMLNMQTIMRRRKIVDEKMSKFGEMLIDNSKQEFSEKVLTMAADIRKVFGRSGYDKLLSYGFPLPPLPALRKGILGDDFTDPSKGDIGEVRVRDSIKKINVKTEETRNTNNVSEIDEKDTELPDSVGKTTEYEGADTVTGTVQDIFDENNDGDDFSTNELREHFILQLNAVM
ncbi:uncharacterized protein LOC143429664 isoform X2 [Xylocopa sonorina]|uniref:uncharacterized protein LOC143429664 isoform X2 n=1 Tax=Xylocopa sonorina TaxID=1818115 RepID=UPI00403B34D7